MDGGHDSEQACLPSALCFIQVAVRTLQGTGCVVHIIILFGAYYLKFSDFTLDRTWFRKL
jgi:hypothetical protein